MDEATARRMVTALLRRRALFLYANRQLRAAADNALYVSNHPERTRADIDNAARRLRSAATSLCKMLRKYRPR
jgi:hypothetical protein